ncbi:MAG: C40 family peptidase [Lachnospiraceae bacterium]
MKFKNYLKVMSICFCMGVLLLPSMKAEAAFSEVLSAGVETMMNQTDDETVLASAIAPSIVEGYTVLGVVNAADGYVNIREEATTDSGVAGKIAKDAVCEVVSSDGEWSKIASGEIEGYISNEFLLTGASANERAAELMEAGTEFQTAITMMEYRYGIGVTDIQMEVCEYAKQFVGNPYVWGGTSLTHGADCSGFTLSVYKNYGVSLPHSSRAQANCGTSVSLSEVQPGDLIFYGGSRIHHVALYIGNGQIVHAQSAKTGIVISSMYYNTPTKAVRVLDV